MDGADLEFPKPPSFSDDELKRAEESGDYSPILFEWYKFVGSLAVLIAHIQSESPAFKDISASHYHVLVGLLNRCARLMLSNIALSHEGRFGETTAIVDRCIFESAVKVVWLCQNPSQEKFVRYLADGLKTELEFRRQIQANIEARGEALPIESRMLESISNHIAASGVCDAEIASSKKLPDLASLLDEIGHSRLIYVIGQKIGSHHIHGTWPSLLMHYLDEREDKPLSFAPRAHHCDTYVHQYTFVCLMVLDAMEAYLRLVLRDEADSQGFVDLFRATERELMRLLEATP